MSVSTPPPSSDRRRHPRYEILAQVRFRRIAATHVLDVGNISRSGLFVRTPDEKSLRRVQVGETLELELFTQEDLHNIPVRGRVVRIVGEGPPAGWGFGLEFFLPDDEARAAIAELVDKAAATTMPPPAPPPLPPRPSPEEPFIVLPPTVETPGRGEGSRGT
jgi:hypothetical protein